MKQTVVIKVSMDGHKYCCFRLLDGQKARSKALKVAVGLKGVVSASLKGQDKDQIEVKGNEIDTVKLAALLRKKVGHADIVTVVEEKEDKKKDEVKNMVWYCGGGVPSYPIHVVSDYKEPTLAPSCNYYL